MSDSTMTNTMLRKNDLKLKIAVYVVSIAIVLLILLPFVLMMAENVLHPETYTMDSTGKLTKIVYNNVSVINSFKNSMLVTVGATFLNVYFSSLTAYAITAYEWKLKTVFSNLITAFMMLPNTIALIGFYQLTWKFHLINNLMMLILPAVATPLTVFFMRMYLQATFSMSIVESGRLDGASEFRIFNQIVLPMLKPAMATQIIFAFVSNWYNTFVPSIILIDDKAKTLALTPSPEWLLVLPPIIVYLICSRFIVEGVALGSVKT
ncbi:MAG: carbohydrate ABC transporter permease [Clostridiales bacterium]|nr:carbohydrate ABC transporter permease [Clostridiales bacterium]